VQRYVQALQTLAGDPAASAVLFIHAPTAIVPSAEIARALVPLANASAPRLMSCWLGDAAVAEARHIFQQAGIASYETPEEAVRAFAMGVTYRRNQAQLLEAPPAALPGPPMDTGAVQAMVLQALESGRDMLTEPEAKAVLAAYRIPVVATQTVSAEPDEAANSAAGIGFPVVLKILSDDISHKSDVGGVVLNLGNRDEVRAAAQAMLERVRRARPEARLQGFTVQAMVRRAHAQELIVGTSIDRVFGPVMLFGQGGTAVEVLADRAVALPPLNVPLARALVARTRVSRLLQGWRDTPPVEEAALLAVLVAVSQLLADIPEIAELDINPLIANFEGAIALDARIRLAAHRPAGAHNFAIRPYPAELIQSVPWCGRTITVRPIRPEDEAQHREFITQLDPEDVRMRVFYSRRRSIEHSELARLVQIDYEREMAFVAVAPDADGTEQTLGVVRAVVDPDNRDAEFGIIVRSDLKGQGLGELLMDKLIRYLRARGTQRLVGTVIPGNQRMRELARDLGFVEGEAVAGDGTRDIHLDLQPRAA
jgi:acetyltransferase